MRTPHMLLQPLLHFYHKTPEGTNLRETVAEMRFYRDLLHLFHALPKPSAITSSSLESPSKSLHHSLLALQEKIKLVRTHLEIFLNHSIPTIFKINVDCSAERIQLQPMRVALDVMDRLEATAFLSHIFQKEEETALSFLQCGANENERSFSGKSVLELSIQYGLQKVVAQLCKKFNTLDISTFGFGDTPLHLAARQPALQILKTLLIQSWYDSPSKIDKYNDLGQTAIMEAIRYGHATHIDYLLAKCAQINLVDANGWSPLVCAVLQDPPIEQNACIEVLLKHNAEVNFEIGPCTTALTVACCMGRLSVVKQLVEAGATIKLLEYEEEDEQQPIEKARSEGHLDVVEWLEEQIPCNRPRKKHCKN